MHHRLGISPLAFEALVAEASALSLRMALDQTTTLKGVLLIRAAEASGKRRWDVLRTADRRVAELGGEASKAPVKLVVEAQALDADQVAWQEARTPPSRVVSATGRARWTGRL